METIGSFEAKTHLAALLERASRGETIVITKHGRPMARLMPPEGPVTGPSIEEIIAGLRDLRKSLKPQGESAKVLINEGRKY